MKVKWNQKYLSGVDRITCLHGEKTCPFLYSHLSGPQPPALFNFAFQMSIFPCSVAALVSLGHNYWFPAETPATCWIWRRHGLWITWPRLKSQLQSPAGCVILGDFLQKNKKSLFIYLAASNLTCRASQVALVVKNLPANTGDIRDMGWDNFLEEGMATHSSILVWRILWIESLAGYSPWGCKELDTTEAT